jgi:SAM-dependent methyltransferase
MVDFTKYEKDLSASYDEAANDYRRDDEIEVQSENHQRLCGNLGRLSGSFGREIDVLDAGCGTGRHFHCLKNVRRLVGLDISEAMLQAAANPVRKADVSAQEIELVRGSVYEQSFPAGSFDLIYSLGVFGHGAQITAELCAKLHQWLRPGGRLYFNTIESSVDPTRVAVRKKIRRAVYPVLPSSVQRKLDEREARYPVFRMQHDEMESIVTAGGFKDFTVAFNVCRTPLWKGVHLECCARK